MERLKKLRLDMAKLDAEIEVEKRKLADKKLKRNLLYVGDCFSNGESVLIELLDCYFGSSFNDFEGSNVFFKALVIDLNANSDSLLYYDEFSADYIMRNGNWYEINKSEFMKSLKEMTNDLLEREDWEC